MYARHSPLVALSGEFVLSRLQAEILERGSGESVPRPIQHTFPHTGRDSVRGARSRREGGTGVTAINSSPIGPPLILLRLSLLFFFSSHLLYPPGRYTRAISVNQIRRSVEDRRATSRAGWRTKVVVGEAIKVERVITECTELIRFELSRGRCCKLMPTHCFFFGVSRLDQWVFLI